MNKKIIISFKINYYIIFHYLRIWSVCLDKQDLERGESPEGMHELAGLMMVGG